VAATVAAVAATAVADKNRIMACLPVLETERRQISLTVTKAPPASNLTVRIGGNSVRELSLLRRSATARS
jgi:hypothetical protein